MPLSTCSKLSMLLAVQTTQLREGRAAGWGLHIATMEDTSSLFFFPQQRRVALKGQRKCQTMSQFASVATSCLMEMQVLIVFRVGEHPAEHLLPAVPALGCLETSDVWSWEDVWPCIWRFSLKFGFAGSQKSLKYITQLYTCNTSLSLS